jgi:hypothetical protein
MTNVVGQFSVSFYLCHEIERIFIQACCVLFVIDPKPNVIFMKTWRKNLSACALMLIVVMSGCKKDDPEPDACKGAKFEMVYDGQPFTGVSFENTLIKASTDDYAGKRMDIRATDASGNTMIITFIDNSTGVEGNGISTDDYVAIDDASSALETDHTFFATILHSDGLAGAFYEGTFDLTACDADRQTVSGTFSFSNGEETVATGAFSDLCYTVFD